MMKRNWSNNFHRDIRQNLNGDYSLNVRNVWDIQFEKYISFQKCIRYEGMGKETGLLLLRVDYITAYGEHTWHEITGQAAVHRCAQFSFALAFGFITVFRGHRDVHTGEMEPCNEWRNCKKVENYMKGYIRGNDTFSESITIVTDSRSIQLFEIEI